MKNIGVLIYTYNRIDDAKINMDIIRCVWGKLKFFKEVIIVHSYNGEKVWYPNKYLENDLVVIKNNWHYQGASELIDAGIRKFQKKYKNIDYIIVLASDTWIIKPTCLEEYLIKMEKDNLYLATCPWGLPERNKIKDVGMAVDFFIIDLKWASHYKMFPINYLNFSKKYEDLFLYQMNKKVLLEKLLYVRFLKAINLEINDGSLVKEIARKKMLIFNERDPVHSHIDEEGYWIRNNYWSEMGLLTHHDAEPKKEILMNEKIKDGNSIKKLLESEDLSYYNKLYFNLIGKLRHDVC